MFCTTRIYWARTASGDRVAPTKEPGGGIRVTPRDDQNAQHDTVLVDQAPQDVGLDEYLAEMGNVGWLTDTLPRTARYTVGHRTPARLAPGLGVHGPQPDHGIQTTAPTAPAANARIDTNRWPILRRSRGSITARGASNGSPQLALAGPGSPSDPSHQGLLGTDSTTMRLRSAGGHRLPRLSDDADTFPKIHKVLTGRRHGYWC